MAIDLRGVRQLQTRFKAVQRAPVNIMRTLGLRAVKEQKSLAPVRTGNLRRTIHLASATASEAVTVASARYAGVVERGSAPHVIVPRRRKALRFKGTGGVVFAKRVNHPGTKPQPFMLPGARKAVDETVGVKPIIDDWNSAA